MENIEQLIEMSQDLYIRLDVIKNLVYRGMCCQAYEKMQGALVKNRQLLEALGEENGVVANKSPETQTEEETESKESAEQ